MDSSDIYSGLSFFVASIEKFTLNKPANLNET